MRILVAGGLGFKGVNFIMHMLDNNADCFIVNVDRLTTGNNVDFQFLGDYYKNYVFINGDISNRALVKDTLERYDISEVINFVSVKQNDESGQESPEVISAIYNFMEECRLYSINKFINISSTEVYGGGVGITSYEHSMLKPYDFSSFTACSSDLLCNTFYELYGFPVVTLRMCNLFGAYQNRNRFVPSIIDRALNNSKISIYGDGLDIRSWMFVQDAVDVMVAAFKRGRVGQTYNVSYDCYKKDIDIVEFILDYLGKDYKLIGYRERALGRDRNINIDARKMKNELLCASRYSFNSSFEDTIDWYCRNTL